MPDRVRTGPNYNSTVISILGRISASGTIDQSQLRQLVALAPSYLVLDSTTYPTTAEGVAEWSQGMNRICDVVVALHRKLALELETLNEVSRSCAESWVVCGSWRGLDSGRTAIQRVAARLKENVLDPDGVKYKGETVYTS